MKSIKELTEEEAKEIFDFVFADEDEYRGYSGLAKVPIIEEDGSMRVTMGLRPIVGIKYRNDSGDGCLLPFDNTKVMLWLYKNGYDIEEQLEYNKDLTKVEHDIENLAYAVSWHCEQQKDHTMDTLKKVLIERIDYFYYDREY